MQFVFLHLDSCIKIKGIRASRNNHRMISFLKIDTASEQNNKYLLTNKGQITVEWREFDRLEVFALVYATCHPTDVFDEVAHAVGTSREDVLSCADAGSEVVQLLAVAARHTACCDVWTVLFYNRLKREKNY